MAKVSELDLLEMISRSEVDKELIAILSGRDPDKMDALEGLEHLRFFSHISRATKRNTPVGSQVSD